MNYRDQCLPQEWLRSGKSLAELETTFKIVAKRHSQYPNLVQLKYNQIESNFNEELVRQCRGIILDQNYNWAVVARPFDKFGNYGESYAAKIDWKTVTIQEKIDGSLMILYFYDKKWQVATSGTPDASGEVNGYGMTFKDLFWDTWKAKKYVAPSHFQEHMTFMFELTSPFNKVVVKQAACDLRLIGVRNNLTGQEAPISNFIMWDLAKSFVPVKDINELIDSFKTMDPLMQEGYVIVDRNFNRNKVKHPGYVVLHHMRDSLSPKNILEIVRSGETSEVIVSFPEWTDLFNQVKANYDGLVMVLEQAWDELKDIKGAFGTDVKAAKKCFALEANKTIHPGTLFALYNEHAHSVREALSKVPIDRLMEILRMNKLEPVPF